MMKNSKFPAGTFLEIDDLSGGRKVVQVCKDGITYWDVLDVNAATPIVIHSMMAPKELHTYPQFVRERGLGEMSDFVIAQLAAEGDARYVSDPLYLMRIMWFLARKKQENPQWKISVDDLHWAIEQTLLQEHGAMRIQQYAKDFVAQGA